MADANPLSLPDDGRPANVRWDYDPVELRADALIHVLGVAFALIGGTVLTLRAAESEAFWPVLVYALSLALVLGLSAAYNMWPVSPTKWRLRRFDHAAIFLLIAGTYTPLLTRLPDREALLLAGLVWSVALLGVVLKLGWPGRGDRAAVGLYLVTGWCGVIAVDAVVSALPGRALKLILGGGVLYTLGTIFHLWESLRFQNALWHAFVLAASVCLYLAVLHGVVLPSLG